MSITRIPFLYIYNTEENTFEKISNLRFNALKFQEGTRQEELRFFADNLKHRNIEVRGRPEDVFYHFSRGSYNVWLMEDDEKKALYLIGMQIVKEIETYSMAMQTQVNAYNNIIDNLVDFAKKYKIIEED